MKKAAIIGGSGFIGSYVTKTFLANHYSVKVSATDISKEEKYQHLRKLDNAQNLEIEQLDVQDSGALKAFMQDCNILVHAGTPFQLDVDDPQKELFDPTIKGTENMLKLISETPSIKKVVFVASVAAYNTAFPFPAGSFAPDQVVTENDTPFFDESNHPYAQAKHFADQAVKKFVKEQPQNGLEITSLFPVFVVGPALSERQDSSSVGFQFLIKNKMTPDPFMEMLTEQNVEFAMVDVNDVAQAVFNAAMTSGLHGKNYFLTSESWAMSDISLMLNGKQPEGQARVVYSNEAATKDLGINFNPAHVPLGQFG